LNIPISNVYGKRCVLLSALKGIPVNLENVFQDEFGQNMVPLGDLKIEWL